MDKCKTELQQLTKEELVARLHWVIQMMECATWEECADKLLDSDSEQLEE